MISTILFRECCWGGLLLPRDLNCCHACKGHASLARTTIGLMVENKHVDRLVAIGAQHDLPMHIADKEQHFRLVVRPIGTQI